MQTSMKDVDIDEDEDVKHAKPVIRIAMRNMFNQIKNYLPKGGMANFMLR